MQIISCASLMNALAVVFHGYQQATATEIHVHQYTKKTEGNACSRISTSKAVKLREVTDNNSRFHVSRWKQHVFHGTYLPNDEHYPVKRSKSSCLSSLSEPSPRNKSCTRNASSGFPLTKTKTWEYHCPALSLAGWTLLWHIGKPLQHWQKVPSRSSHAPRARLRN